MVDRFTILKALYPTGQPAHLGEADQNLETSTSRLSSILRSLCKSRLSGTPKPPNTLALQIILQLPSMLRSTSTSRPPFTLSPPTLSKLLGCRANNAHISALLLPSRRMSHWRPANWPLEGTSHLEHSQSTLLKVWILMQLLGPGWTRLLRKRLGPMSKPLVNL